MKTTIKILLLLFVLENNCVAQYNKVNTMKVRKSNHCLGVELTNLNVLYQGVENPILIVYSGNRKLLVKIDKGTIKETEPGKYVVQINEGRAATISMYEVHGNANKIIGEKKYRVLAIPKPYAMFAGKKSGDEITKALLLIGSLSVINDNFLFDVRYKIVSYSISVNFGGDFKTENFIGDILSDRQIVTLTKLKNNQYVYIEDIKVQLLDGGCPNMILPAIMLRVRG